MSVNPVDKLEFQLQTLIEGAFARLFRRTISARDIAVLLLRAIEDKAAAPAIALEKPIAPDHFTIGLHPQNIDAFLAEYPNLASLLARLIIDLSEESGFQLLAEPRVVLQASQTLTILQASITAEHSAEADGRTAIMQAVDSPLPLRSLPFNPQLHVDRGGAHPLEKSVVNIGRDSHNDIVIADAYMSRHHLQLRKRLGAFTLFDVNSRSGTRVNDQLVTEHRLRSGDVISIGHSTLVYTDDNDNSAGDGTTEVLFSCE